MSRKESMLAMLRRERSVLEQKMMMIEKLPDEDTYADGAMIRVVVDGGRMTYLLLKVVKVGSSRDPRIDVRDEVRWYYTGNAHRVNERWMSWEQLTTWIAGVGLESWDDLIAKSDVPLDADHPSWRETPDNGK